MGLLTELPPLAIRLDAGSPVPLYRQLYDELCAAILGRRLVPGTRLPSTRTLAAELGVSRMTVVVAYEQLLAEGYLEGKVGSGTFVAHALPEEYTHAQREPIAPAPSLRSHRAPSNRGQRMVSAAQPRMQMRGGQATRIRAFRTGVPALDRFPFDLWQRLVAKSLRSMGRDLLNYGDPAGYRPLREAVAAYLGASRAVQCSADQVIITTGTQPALDLATQLLLDPGDLAWIEDPGYSGGRSALISAGARVVPVPVDAEGLQVAVGMALTPLARMVYVTPSHQYPLGTTMSLRRRLALLEWARQSNAWIIEDDYDSEYRYTGRPLPALQGLDTAGRVIYVGTFSKVLFPALRLGYVVVPDDLVNAFASARVITDDHPPILEQLVVTQFITEGHFARHIRRMRTLYAERQATLLAEGRVLEGLVELVPSEAGLHLVGWLPHGADDGQVARLALRAGVDTAPLTDFYQHKPERGGLTLGFAAYDQPDMHAGMTALRGALS